MLNEYAKQDTGAGFNLENAFKSLGGGDDGGLLEELEKALTNLVESSAVPELDGYYPYRILVGERYYYPRRGTLRVLPIGQTIFADELASPTEGIGKPVYITLDSRDIGPITWSPIEDEETAEAVLPLAA